MSANPVIGIDVAKEFCYYAILSPEGKEYCKPFKAFNTEKGLRLVVKKIEEVTQTFASKPAIVLESTGHYSNRLVHFFLRNDLEVYLINPLLSHSIKNLAIRKVKSDKVDAQELAKLFFLKDLRQYQQNDAYFDNLKALTRASSSLAKQRVQAIQQLTTVVEQCMPNFTKVFKNTISSKTSLAILSNYPTPQAILDAPKDEIVTLIKTTARKSVAYGCEKHDLLTKMAKESLYIGVALDAYTWLISLHTDRLSHIDAQIKAVDEQINEIALMLPEIELLVTIPGIGPKLAPLIAAEIGDIKRFDHAKKVVAFCGIDPSVKQSGNFVGSKNKLTKRGSPFVRKALYLAATVAISKKGNGYNNKVIHDYYHEKIKTKAKKQALGAVMNKLVRIIFSVLSNKRPFISITPEQQVKMYKANMKLAA